MKEFVYDVFTRKERGDRLQHVGYVDAFDDETADDLAVFLVADELVERGGEPRGPS